MPLADAQLSEPWPSCRSWPAAGSAADIAGTADGASWCFDGARAIAITPAPATPAMTRSAARKPVMNVAGWHSAVRGEYRRQDDHAEHAAQRA
jgi:hypothetical protein